MADRDSMAPWEVPAQEAIEELVRTAELDHLRGEVSLRDYDPRGRETTIEFSNLEDLEDHLVEVYNVEFYANAPFEGGEAVFRDDARGVVGDLLSDHSQLADLLAESRHEEDAVLLATADELLDQASSSKVVRISLEEVNEELIGYLAANPSRMHDLTPRKFEELVAEMFRDRGYDVELTPPTRDGGIDLIAVRQDNVGTVMLLVECKRYGPDQRVGVGVARSLYGVVEQKGATRGLIASTAYFTRDAIEFRDSVKFRLGLADFDELTRMIGSWKGVRRQ